MPVYEEKNKNKWTKDGRKYYFKTQYTDMYGKRKAKKSGMYKSRPAAKRAEDEFLAKVATTDETDLDISFEGVYKEWFLIKSRTVKDNTANCIKGKINSNILKFFKDYKLHNIKINIIFRWYEIIDSKDCTNDYKNLIISYLKEILNYAVDNYNFDKKIVSKIEPKKDNEIRKIKHDSEWNFWTYEEFEKFISKVDDEFYYKIFNFLYFTGLRKSEMFALTWNDLDFERKTLSINKQITNKTGTGTYKITSTKTKNSDGIIELDDALMDLLKKHYEYESKNYGFNSEMFIFGNIKPVSATTLARELDYYIYKSKVKRITPHGFRHSHASLLIHLGCDEYEVANRLRDTVEVVRSTYYHMFPEKKTSTIKILNNFKNNKITG